MAVSEAKQDAKLGEIFGTDKVAVYFSAPWCEPCKVFYPRFKEVVKEIDGLTALKVNVDQYPEVGAFLGIRSIPTMVFLHNGENLGMKIGVQNEEDLLEFLRSKYGSE